jgi:capsular polysaccharide biosynthesis protein
LDIEKYFVGLGKVFSQKRETVRATIHEPVKVHVESNFGTEQNGLLKINIDMQSQFYQINILKFLNKWKFHLGIIVLIAIVLAAIFSSPMFITPKFKSFAIVYPSNISPYSDESETEQMLQILQSSDIRDSIIRKFSLAKHYKIDSSYKYFRTTMIWEYSQNVRVSKTTFEGINIEVMDKDPKIACDMVNSIIYYYNKKVRKLHEDKFKEVVELYDRSILKKQHYIDSLENRFVELSTTYGLLDYGNQSREIARGYLRTIDGSSGINTKEVLRLKQNIELKGGEFMLLQSLIQQEAGKFSELKREYEKAYMNFDRRFSYTNVITEPFVADKKSFPVRWLIVVITSLATFFVAFLAILIFENYKGLVKNS